MTSSLSENAKFVIRPVQYRDLEAIETLASQFSATEQFTLNKQLQQVRRWYGLLKFLSLFPNPFQHRLRVYVAEQIQQLQGIIQISPFNSSRSTWRVEQVLVDKNTPQKDIGSQLLRYCFETVWEARTWLLEVNIHEKETLALYRQNGFQPLAEMTYWSLSPELLAQLAQHELDLPNLLPVSNADAQLLYQLDCVSMPPLLRQVFDRHIQDFKSSFWVSVMTKIKQWCDHSQTAKAYVFEPQRKAAIGYFKLDLCHDGSRAHQAQLTVHPAYTWLYPQLFAQMAKIAQNLPPQSLEFVSADYQHEREEYLEKLGAHRVEHALLMSRSVWHKLKEVKPEGLQLSEMLQGLQPVPRTPIPSRISWLKWPSKALQKTSVSQGVADLPSGSTASNPASKNGGASVESSETPENGHHA